MTDHLHKTSYGVVYTATVSVLGVVGSTLLFWTTLNSKTCYFGALLIIATILATALNVGPMYETYGDILVPFALYVLPMFVNLFLNCAYYYRSI